MRYGKYKDSGIEWIGEIPEHWNLKRLKYLVSLNDETLSEKTDNETLIDYIEIGDLKNGVISSTEYRFENAPSRARRIVRTGDVIVSTVRTYLKAIAQISKNRDGQVASTGFAVLRPNKIDSRFLGYYSHSPFFIDSTIANSVGVTYPAINASDILEFPIQIPTPEEQTAIANYLDRKTAEIDELIADKKRLLELYEEEKTAIINQAVTKGINPDVPMKVSGIEWLGEIPEHWEVKKLKYLGNIVLGKMLTSSDKGNYHKRKYLRAANIGWLKVNIEDVKEMWFSDDELISLRLNKNDLLVSEGGEVGRTCIWKNELKECYIQNSVHKVTLNNSDNPFYYLYQFFLYGQKGAFDAIVNRISIAHLTGEKIRNIDFPVPPLEEQTTIVQFIETETARINVKAEKTKKLIDLLTEYRTALISEVVTGKIKVI